MTPRTAKIATPNVVLATPVLGGTGGMGSTPMILGHSDSSSSSGMHGGGQGVLMASSSSGDPPSFSPSLPTNLTPSNPPSLPPTCLLMCNYESFTHRLLTASSSLSSTTTTAIASGFNGVGRTPLRDQFGLNQTPQHEGTPQHNTTQPNPTQPNPILIILFSQPYLTLPHLHVPPLPLSLSYRARHACQLRHVFSV